MLPADGAALIRVAAYPSGLALPAWPDLTCDQPEQWQEWLCTVWALPEFATAVTSAAPALAEQIVRAFNSPPLPTRKLRRLVEALLRYLLRWTTRATPFGRFAGVAPVGFGPRTQVRWGEAHRPTIRPGGEFVAERTARAEHDLAMLRGVAVVTNSLGYRRGRFWVLPCARTDGDRRWDLTIRLTRPAEAAIQAAVTPIRFADLAASIAGAATVDVGVAERLLASMVQSRVLVSALRPAMTVTDPQSHLAENVTMPEAGDQAGVDLRVDTSVTLPPAVLSEASQAASALIAVATHFPGWVEYHHAFIQRWGPAAAVPLRDVLDALGFPAGYRRSTRRVPVTFDARDRALLQVAQRAALNGCAEVVLDDELIDRLRGDHERPPVPHTELRFTLAAATARDLDRGAFTLTVVSGSRHAGVASARFLHLFTPDELAPFQKVYQSLPTVSAAADKVQLSGPPLDAHLDTLTWVPELLPVLPVGDFHPAPRFTVADLAVAGDGRRLWLVSQATGRPVEPLLLNSVLLPGLQQPLMRFLTEIWSAWNAPCSRFDWGHATDLPFLPRIRRGRAILHPARWTIDRSALPAPGTAWPQWREAWQRYRDHYRLPREILVGGDGAGLRLDLDNDTHLTVLRRHVNRHDRTVVFEAPATAGWIDDRPAELLLTLTHTPPAARPAEPTRAARPVSRLRHPPGQAPWLEARLWGSPDDILADLTEQNDRLLSAGWWFLRYPDPEHHLRLRIPTPDVGQFHHVTRALAQWTHELERNGVLHDYTLHTYRPETRYGTGPALAAAETVFAADSRAVLRRLAEDREPATAASMITIVDGFNGNAARWLADNVPHCSGPRLNPTQLDHARNTFHDQALTAALVAYRAQIKRHNLNPNQVLADLLHLHHARMIGVNQASERHCLRLARAVARSSHVRTAS
ncbi:lantibiotic dehydratase [Catellatospora citrea]|nr:lantibiotic dehydratase [Catellatospora citrea]